MRTLQRKAIGTRTDVFLIEGFLAPSECAGFIAASEGVGYEEATISA